MLVAVLMAAAGCNVPPPTVPRAAEPASPPAAEAVAAPPAVAPAVAKTIAEPVAAPEPAAPAPPEPDLPCLDWIKVNQDTSSPGRQLVADIIGGASAQTFNNSLAAMAFLLAGERERAERILDWYAAATDRANTDPRKQNFFLRGEARGFYQNAAIRDLPDAKAGQAIWNGDRWMGDMTWLLFAYQHYARLHGPGRYDRITALLCDLLAAWYVPRDTGGYIGSGWRNFDERLHEADGHPEGNIDAYAALLMCGNRALAQKVEAWLLPRIGGHDRPLDLFTWKVLAFGPRYRDDLALLETVGGYRKTIEFRGRPVTGFTSARNQDANIWSDGLGHVACAWYSVGDTAKGDFYLRELGKLIFEQTVDGRAYATIPYTATRSPGYEWVDPAQGFVSACAWHILASKKFNPMRLD